MERKLKTRLALTFVASASIITLIYFSTNRTHALDARMHTMKIGESSREKANRATISDQIDVVEQASLESFPASDAPGWRL